MWKGFANSKLLCNYIQGCWQPLLSRSQVPLKSTPKAHGYGRKRNPFISSPKHDMGPVALEARGSPHRVCRAAVVRVVKPELLLPTHLPHRDPWTQKRRPSHRRKRVPGWGRWVDLPKRKYSRILYLKNVSLNLWWALFAWDSCVLQPLHPSWLLWWSPAS